MKAQPSGFGARLKEARTKKGLSQRELARASGYDQVSLSRVENGDIIPRVDTVVKIAKVLDLDAAGMYALLAEVEGAVSEAQAPERREQVSTPSVAGSESAQLWKAVALLQQSVSALQEPAQERGAQIARIDERLGNAEGRIDALETRVGLTQPPRRKASGSHQGRR